jgi:hypothetical protein
MDKLTALNQTQIVGSIPEAVLTVRTYATTALHEPRFSVQIATQHPGYRTPGRRRPRLAIQVGPWLCGFWVEITELVQTRESLQAVER